MSDSTEQKKIEVGQKIIQWLKEESLKFQEESDPYFTVRVVFYPSENVPLFMLIEKQKIDSVRIMARFTFTEQDKMTLAGLKEGKRIDFVRRLREALFHSRVTASFYPNYNNIQYIETYKTIYFDGLSKHRFFTYTDDITRAFLWLGLEYEKLNGSHKTNFLTGFIL